MSEEDQFERTDYGKLNEGQSSADFTTAQNDLKVAPQCSHDACTNAVEDPAEPAWVKLMSAVPVATQIDSLKASREGTMMLPEGKTIQSMVASIRPQPEADYALDTIRDEWVEFQEAFASIAPKLKEGLASLSGFWKGDDFDAFEEQAETVLKNCKTVSGDIAGEDGNGGVVKLLDDKQAEIFEQQGGTSCVYPAPKFYMQGTSCGSHQIHIRPPFFKNCEIHKNDEIAKAVELAGFDPTVIDEVQEGRETTYNRWIEYVNANPEYEVDGLKGEELARKKADEYADERLISLGAKGSDQLEEEAARVNEEVTERHANVEAHVQEIAPDVRKGEQTTFNDGETDKFDPPELDTGDGGGMPDLNGAGIDDQAPPGTLHSLGTGPDANGLNENGLNGNGLGGNGFNGGGNPPGGVNGAGDLSSLNDENPFKATDPDDLTGSGTNLPAGYNGGGGLDSLGGNGFGPNGGGAPPGDYTGGTGLEGLDDNPWNSTTDPDDVSGGLAGGGPTGLPPSSIGGGSGLGPGSSHLPPPMATPAPSGTRGITPPRSSGPRKLDSGRGTGLNPNTGGTGPRKLDSGRSSGGLTGKGLGGTSGGGAPPGSTGGRGSGLGSGTGGGRGLGGGIGAGGAGAGAAGAGAGGRGAAGAGGMMAPGVAGGGQRPGGDDKEMERQFWIAEDEDVWGGGPEDEEEDPYA
ncbi:hypothetical protein [Glycomyces sp. NPDC021274]|uniref:hypothetical protein n=1 Tax=Glycomyces sp. NPDC021274 TaxID=3155120 RepID=UPI0033EBACE0